MQKYTKNQTLIQKVKTVTLPYSFNKYLCVCVVCMGMYICKMKSVSFSFEN